jgi:hypothetical protein
MNRRLFPPKRYSVIETSESGPIVQQVVRNGSIASNCDALCTYITTLLHHTCMHHTIWETGGLSMSTEYNFSVCTQFNSLQVP